MNDSNMNARLPWLNVRLGEPERNRSEIGLGENNFLAPLGRIKQANSGDINFAFSEHFENTIKRCRLKNAISLHLKTQGPHDFRTKAGHAAIFIKKRHWRRILEDNHPQGLITRCLRRDTWQSK
jgi:hypothetical protein